MSEDPFAGSEKFPSISWKTAKVGDVVTGTVVSAPALVQARDYETGDRATWPDGNPKMTVVITLDVNGEKKNLWAPKPSAMFAAIGSAQSAAGAKIQEGGTLAIKFTGEIPNAKNPRLNPQKQYAVKYDPPKGSASSDPWATPTNDDTPPF